MWIVRSNCIPLLIKELNPRLMTTFGGTWGGSSGESSGQRARRSPGQGAAHLRCCMCWIAHVVDAIFCFYYLAHV